MRVTVRFFAMLRDAADGQQSVELELADGARVADAADDLSRRWPKVASLLARTSFAVNRNISAREHVLRDGDELALIPPVSGG